MNGDLMTLAEFREYSKQHALDSMRARGRDLLPKAEAAWQRVTTWQARKAVVKEFEVAKSYHLTREQFERRMRVVNLLEKVQGNLDAAYEKWAALDTELNTITRDPRYVEWKTGKRAIRVTADDMMSAMGYRKASGE